MSKDGINISVKNKHGVPGNKAIEMAFAKYNKNVNKELEHGIELAAIKVEGTTKKNIWTIKATQGKLIDTGRMINSITHEVIAKGKKLIGLVGTNVWYASDHELGTKRIPARPFLRPALRMEKKFIKDVLKKSMNKAGKESSK